MYDCEVIKQRLSNLRAARASGAGRRLVNALVGKVDKGAHAHSEKIYSLMHQGTSKRLVHAYVSELKAAIRDLQNADDVPRDLKVRAIFLCVCFYVCMYVCMNRSVCVFVWPSTALC